MKRFNFETSAPGLPGNYLYKIQINLGCTSRIEKTNASFPFFPAILNTKEPVCILVCILPKTPSYPEQRMLLHIAKRRLGALRHQIAQDQITFHFSHHGLGYVGTLSIELRPKTMRQPEKRIGKQGKILHTSERVRGDIGYKT